MLVELTPLRDAWDGVGMPALLLVVSRKLYRITPSDDSMLKVSHIRQVNLY